MTGDLYADINDAFVIETIEIAVKNYLSRCQYRIDYEGKPSLNWFNALDARTSEMIERLKNNIEQATPTAKKEGPVQTTTPVKELGN